MGLPVWSRYGDNGNKWYHAQVVVDNQTSSYQVSMYNSWQYIQLNSKIIYIYIYICIYIYIYIYIYTGWRKKKLTCLIYFNLKTKRAIRPKLRALHSVLYNLNFDIRPVQFRAILTERAAFKLE